METGVSNPQPPGLVQPRMAVNVAQHKIVNFLTTLRFFMITCCDVFNMWPKTTLLSVRPREAKRLDTPASIEVICYGSV